MTEISAAQREVLLAELELHKVEFTALREEVLQSIAAERQSLNLSLIAAGAGLGAMPLISTPNALVVLLLFPLVFHVILWEMLNAVRTVSRISNYLTGILIPRVNAILDELGSKRQDSIALGWEPHIATLPMRTRELILTSLTPTRHWVPILTVAALLIAYNMLSNYYSHAPSPGEIALALLNLALLVWAAIQNTITARASMQQAQQLRQVSSQSQVALQETPVSKSKDKAGLNGLEGT